MARSFSERVPAMTHTAVRAAYGAVALALLAVLAAPAADATPKCSDAGPTVTYCQTKGSTALTATPPPWNWGGWPGYGYPFPVFGAYP
jgi:hypothetical protein